MHVDVERPIFCPECASELNKKSTETTSEIDECLFGTLYRNRMYETIKCSQCMCVMRRKTGTVFTSTWKMHHFIWMIISILIAILSVVFFMYGVKTDPNCESWIGPAAVVSFFIAFVSIISTVYNILEFFSGKG